MMDYLQICAKAFEKLLDVQYHIVLGRKGKLVNLNILFEPKEFHHLIGLHKLRDLRLARENREKIFYEILAGKISMEDLKKSRYYSEIQKRLEPFYKIENIFDSNKVVFRYNSKLQTFSLIEAEYLLSTPYENTDIYIFLDRQAGSDFFFCRSFFQKELKDYTKGQAVYTLLKKEKITISTGDREMQYDRISSSTIKNNH
ncbi:PBECR4 domain-containing protein [Clostridium sp.]